MNPIQEKKENFLIRLIDNANLFFLYLDSSGNVLISNRKTEELAAKSKSDIIGKHWFNVLSADNSSPAKQQMFKAMFEDSVKYNRFNNFEGLITDKDNNERIISWDITPLFNETEEPEGILLVGKDVTELKEREASSRKLDDTLKDIFSNIKEYALFVVNLDGNITYYGMGSEIMFGWQKNEIIFKHVNLLFGPDEGRLSFDAILSRVNQSGEYEIELGLVKKDGLVFPVILTASKFQDANGKLLGYIFIAKDITERKKLEYQILQSEKLAAIGQLAAGMAHEINNPLFVISGRLEMIMDQAGLSQEVKDTLKIIYAQADRIRKLVDQLLKFSRKTPPKFETVNINDTIESVLPLLSYHKLPGATVDIVKDFSIIPLFVKGDLNQLQEVFVNLFINAHQSMQDGGTLSIKTGIFLNDYAQIIISDSGQGIAPENLKNLFMPFFSTKKEGTGLGLSICYNIIKNHSGTVEVESQPKSGTTFYIRLPLVKKE